MGVSLTVIHEKAREAEMHQQLVFKNTLEYVVHHPNQLVCIDETHKDRNTSRRRRAYGFKRERIELDGWFTEKVRYTMIGVCNLSGFIKEACHIIRRDDAQVSLTSEGSAGTVDTLAFCKFIEDKLIKTKVLGNYARGDPNSIVVLDNASIHNDPEVKRLIYSQGAIIVMGAPYSPGLNPIEKMFSVYKASLRRNYFTGMGWYDKHEAAMEAVSPEMAFNEFRHCGVPMRDAAPPNNASNFLTKIGAIIILGIFDN